MAQTLAQFGQTIKAKHPEYSDLSDEELGSKMLAKYPQYRDMVDVPAAEPAPSRFASKAIWEVPFSLSGIGKELTGAAKTIGSKLGITEAASDIASALPESVPGSARSTIKELSAVRDTENANDLKLRQMLNSPSVSPEQKARIQSFFANRDQVQTPTVNEINPEINKSAKQVAGDFGTLAATLVGFGSLPGATGTALKGAGVLRGAAQGFRAAAIPGATAGAIGGASAVAQEGGTARDIAIGGTTGAIKTGLAAGAAGGLIGAVAGALNRPATAATAKARKSIEQELTPKLPKTQYTKAAAGGNVSDPGFRTQAGVSADSAAVSDAAEGVTRAAEALGKKPTDIIRSGPLSSATANFNRVHSTIGEYSDDVVRPFLSEQPVPTNFDDFISYLKEVQAPDPIKNEAATSKAFEKVRERIIDAVANSVRSQSGETTASLTDMTSYWNARKVVDQIINEELGAKTLADPARTGVQEAGKLLRKGVADFISDTFRYPGQMEQVARLRQAVNVMQSRGIEMNENAVRELAKQLGLEPSGAEVAALWDEHMTTLFNLYKAEDNLATKISTEQGKNIFQIFGKKHPLLKRTALVVGAGVAGAAGYGGYQSLGGGRSND